MPRPLRALAVLALACSPAAAEPPPFQAEWKFDTLQLKNGATLQGLVLEEGPKGVRFRIVQRKPGRPTVLGSLFVVPADVLRLTKLPDADRAALRAKLDDLDLTPQAEARRLEKIDLAPVDWPAKGVPGLRYESDHFTLVSNAPEEVVRRAAYRLENVYAAFARFLPPRVPGGGPTLIHVHGTFAGYQKAVPAGVALKNPAFYDPTADRIVCGTDLLKLGEDLAQFRAAARERLDGLAKEEAELVRLFGKTSELNRHLQPRREIRAGIEKAARHNEEVFERATRQVFQTLYHEAFHAYVGNFVFPTGKNELPRWLNEGLAQVFETAVFEAGELRLGHADRLRLEKAQDALKKGELPPIADLLTAGPTVFVVRHDAERPAVDRVYVATWALAAFLMFDRRVLGTEALDEFVKAVNAKRDVRAAFETLTGRPLAETGRAFHEWLRGLNENGSMTGDQ
ncbi:MAG TPA: DUF1570 domain-containing protein [Gemmataceae bacterium]|nr:DUF1570 domain-containing protein [Gemmataceae bacterium]